MINQISAPQTKTSYGPFPEEAVRVAAKFLRAKREERSRRNLELWRRADKEARAVSQLIIEHYRPDWLLQWGSIMHPSHFDEFSDIDFAVAGLDASTFDAMFLSAEKLTAFPLHLLRWECTPPEVQELLIQKGRLVYERD